MTKHKLIGISLALVAVISGLVVVATHANPLVPTKPDIQQLWQLTNQDRASAGLAPLVLDSKLSQVATNRCNDMVVRGYYSHYTPDGKPWYTFLDPVIGATWKLAGENIASAPYTAETVNKAFMNSPEHRDAILNPRYNHLGLATCTPHDSLKFGSGSTLVVEDFIQR